MAKKNQDKAVPNTTASEGPNQHQLRTEIEQLAYAQYCQDGYEHGHDLEHWAEAERQVLEQHQRKPKTSG